MAEEIQEVEDISVEELVAEAEVATTLANAERAKADAIAAEFAARKLELEFRRDLTEFESLNGIYIFHRQVTKKAQNQLIQSMYVWHQLDQESPWTIYLNSVGGDMFHGFGIIDEIASYSLRGGGTHHITIKVRGLAASMAAVILQAADERVVGPSSQLMVHKPSVEQAYGTEDVLEDELRWLRRATEWMYGVFRDRGMRLSRDEFMERINRRDWYLTAQDALELGLADHVG